MLLKSIIKIKSRRFSDILHIPLTNTFLWKRYQRQKQGIVDVLLELNHDSRVNIELQIKMLAYWDKRSLFYLSKLFTEGLLSGQKYEKLRRCVCISVLGFDLDERPEYHKVYRLRDESGNEFSDMLELHVIELNKRLSGGDRMDEWIQLFNAETEEELNMLEARTGNRGILEAIKEVRIMSLGKAMRALREERLKEIRDRNAREDYVRSEGIKQGIEQGIEQGEDIKLIAQIQRKLRKGKSLSAIAEELEEPLVNVERISETVLQCGMDADSQDIYEKMQQKAGK